MPRYSKIDYLMWIERIQTEGKNATKWELDFVDSLEQQLERSSTLSERQQEILERIYTQRTP